MVTVTAHPAADASQLRGEIRAARRALTPKLRAQYSQTLVAHLCRNPVLWPTTRVACFWPNDGEVDLRTLFQPLWQRGIQVLLPVIDGPALWFAPYTPATPLLANQFGIAEPAVKRDQACALFAIDLVLMPLVAFDEQGQRLGMGGGYYDRTFAKLRRCKRLHGPRLLGVAFSLQRCERLPTRSWDVPLHGVVTELGLQWFHIKRSPAR